MGRGSGRGTRNFRYHPHAGEATKGFKSAISKIAADTFNTGQNKFATQFTQSQKKHCELPAAHISARRISGGRDGQNREGTNN